MIFRFPKMAWLPTQIPRENNVGKNSGFNEEINMKWTRVSKDIVKRDTKDNDDERIEFDLFFLVFHSIHNQSCRIMNDIYRG